MIEAPSSPRSDPLEREVEEALIAAGIDFAGEFDPRNLKQLDFYLPAYDLYIELKRFHTDRISEQMSRAPNVIAFRDWRRRSSSPA